MAGPANLVSPENLTRMQEPAMPIPVTSLWMGRDWFIQDVDGIRVFTHSGDTLGQLTDFFAIPEHGFAIAVMTNCQPGSLATFAALNAALSQMPALVPLVDKLGLVPALRLPEDAEALATPAGVLDEYAGQYQNPASAISIVAQDGGLEFSVVNTVDPNSWMPVLPPPAPQPGELHLFAPDLAGIPGGPAIPFLRRTDGTVGWAASALRLIPRAGNP